MRKVLVGMVGVAVCAAGAWASLGDASVGGFRGLASCVAAWNAAPLGAGRQVIRGIATFSDRALMFRFRDVGCGIAFSPTATRTSNSEGVYVAVLHGAYPLAASPLTGQGSSHPVGSEAPLQSLSGAHGNVHISAASGRVTALPGQDLPTVSDTILNAGLSCRKVIAPPLPGLSGTAPGARLRVPDNYTVSRSTASCGWIRTIIFAYVVSEGSLVNHATTSPPDRLILGWRCQGHGPWPAMTPAAVSRFRLTCTRPSQIINARAFPSRLIGVS